MGTRLTTEDFFSSNFNAQIIIPSDLALSFALQIFQVVPPPPIAAIKAAELEGNFNLISSFYLTGDTPAISGAPRIIGGVARYLTPAYQVLIDDIDITKWCSPIGISHNKNAVSTFDLTIQRGKYVDGVLFDKNIARLGASVIIRAKLQSKDDFVDLFHGILEVPSFNESVRDSSIKINGRDIGKATLDLRFSSSIGTGTTAIALIKLLFKEAGITNFINFGVTDFKIPGVINIQENKIWDSIMRVASVYNYIVGVDQYGNAYVDEPSYIRTKLPAFIFSIEKNIFQNIEETKDTGIRPNIVRVIGKRSVSPGTGLVSSVSDAELAAGTAREIGISGRTLEYQYSSGTIPSSNAWLPSVVNGAISASVSSNLNFDYPSFPTKVDEDNKTLATGFYFGNEKAGDFRSENLADFQALDFSGSVSPNSQGGNPQSNSQPDTSFAHDAGLNINWQHSGTAAKAFSELWIQKWVDGKQILATQAKEYIGRHRNFDDKVESRIFVAIPWHEPYFMGRILRSTSLPITYTIDAPFKSPFYLRENPIELLSATNVDVSIENATFLPTSSATVYVFTGVTNDYAKRVSNGEVIDSGGFGAPGAVTLLVRQLLKFGYVRDVFTAEDEAKSRAIGSTGIFIAGNYKGYLKKTIKTGFMFITIKLKKTNNNKLVSDFRFKLNFGKISASSPRVTSSNIILENDDAGKGRQIYVLVRDPKRVQKYGEVWADPIENELIRSLTVAKESGRRALLEQRFLSFSTSFETIMNPFLKLGDVIQVENSRLNSVAAYPVESMSLELGETSAKTKIDINRFIGQQMRDKILGIYRERLVNEYGFITASNADKTYDVIIKGRNTTKKHIPAIDGYSPNTGDEVVIGSIDNNPYNNILLGGTGYSGEEVTEIFDVDLLLPPTVIEAVPGNGQITVNWLAIVGAVSYNLYRNETNTLLSNIVGITYLDAGLANLQQYCYYVRGIDEEGFEGETSNIACAVPSADIPAPVVSGSVEVE